MTQSGVGRQGRDHGAGVLSPPSHTNAAPESHPAAPLTRPSLENVQRSYSDATVILLTPKAFHELKNGFKKTLICSDAMKHMTTLSEFSRAAN